MKPLRELRVEQMQTYRELAHASGVSVSTLMYIEKGTRQAHFGTMLAVASALDVGVRDVSEFNAALDKRLSNAA